MSMSLQASKARVGASTGGFRHKSQFRGDPGLFGDIFGGITKVAGFIPGPIGTIAKTAERIFGGGGQSSPPALPQGQQGGPGGTLFAPQQAIPRFDPPFGGQPGVAINPFGPQTAAPIATNGKVAGHHLNKSDYWLKDGTFVPKGTKWVKNRRRNPLNAKAASRAISRLESAKKATKRINRISIRKAPCKR